MAYDGRWSTSSTHGLRKPAKALVKRYLENVTAFSRALELSKLPGLSLGRRTHLSSLDQLFQ